MSRYSKKRLVTKLIACAFAAIACGNPAEPAAAEGERADSVPVAPQETPQLITEKLQVAFDGPQQPSVVRTEFVRLDTTLLEAPEGAVGQGRLALDGAQAVAVSLFDDVSFVVSLTSVEVDNDGTVAWTGSVLDQPAGRALMVVSSGVVTGNLTDGSGGLYEIRPGNIPGAHHVQQIDSTALPPDGQPLDPGAPDRVPDAMPDPLARDAGRLDVLVVYTPAARAAAGGEQQMRDLVRLAELETNEGYRESGLDKRVDVVRVAEIDYVEESGQTYHKALRKIRAMNDGVMDSVHPDRDGVCADAVSLVIEDGDYCGLAYMLTEPFSAFAGSAFSVVNRACATGYYSFGHEIGHNLGSDHDRANSGGGGAYEYSYGYQDPAGVFRTVMAYSCPGGCPRENIWSNPDKEFNGSPTGVPINDPNAANNVASLRKTFPDAVNWRRSAACRTER